MKRKKLTRHLSLLFLFFLFPFVAFAQTITVKGVVKDANGETLIGVSVMEVGTSSGVITDVSGNYEIKAKANSSLSFSYVGYQKQVINVNGRNKIDVVLSDQDKSLNEVVVIGYGTQRKEAVTGSVASVKGDVMREVPSSNITQAMQGRIAGVNLEQTSSKPGATMQIRIRGVRSLSGSNDPLVVLDGIPYAGSIGDLSSDDIKSIDILKDASATAIYGSRGANGVILVTTNKGQKGVKAQVSYNNYYGVKNAIKYPMMNGPEFVALRTLANKYPVNGVDESNDVNTDWQDLYYRQGTTTNHDLNVTGGTDKSNYKFGIGYNRDESAMYGQDYSRYSIRGSLEQEIGKYFKFGFTTNNNYSINKGNNLGLYGVLSMSAITNPYKQDGSLKRIVKMAGDDQFVYTRDVISSLGDQYIDQTKAFSSYNSIYGELKIPGVEGLKLRTNIGGNFRMSNSGSYTGEGVFATNATTPSSASISNSLTTNWAIENLIMYDKLINEKHQINAVAMYSAEQTMYNSSNVSATDIPSDALQFYNLGQAPGDKVTINPDYQGYEVSALTSFMARVMYSYDNRYMISGTFRTDGSSRLAPGYKWHPYYAVSAGWNIKNESFLKDVTEINSLKLRAGIGQTSNQAVPAYATLGRLGTRPYNFGTSYSTGYYMNQLTNPKLGWEYSETVNIGVDFGLLNNRISGSLEVYNTNTKNILYNLALPSTSGVTGYTANIGQIQNRGIEFSVNGVILDNVGGFTWDAGINLYTNHNELTQLASGSDRDENNNFFVGHSLNVLYDFEKVGLWNKSDPDYKYLQALVPGGNEGMIKVKYTGGFYKEGDVIPAGKVVGDPKRAIDNSDRQIIDLDPNFMGGFNTRLAYKGFDLSIVGVFRSGGKLISTLYSSGGYLNMLTGRRGNVKVDYWTPENTDAKYPKPGGIQDGDNPKYGSTLGLFSGSYMKIRTITLGYNFTQKWIKDAGISRLRIYATAQNPFVLFSPYHNETGMDPESNSYGNENAAVAFSQSLKRLLTIGTTTPSTRNFLVGLNLTF